MGIQKKGLLQVTALFILLALLTSCAPGTNESEITMINKISGITVPTAIEIRELPTENYDMTTAQSKNLLENDMTFSQEYIYLQAVYRAGFNRWLDNADRLTAFDTKLQSDPRGFPALPIDGQEYDQKYASFGREYLFILNSFFIERLSEEDLQILRSTTSISDAALEELVVRTYKDVIEVREEDGQPSYSVIYKTTVSGLWEAPADAIVLEIRYRWDYHSVSDSAASDIESKKEKDVNNWRDELAKSLYEQTGSRVFVFIDNL